MKKYIPAIVTGLVSLAPLYLLVLCVVSLMEEGLTRNLAIAHILPCVCCIGGLWVITIRCLRGKLRRLDWWLGGIGVLVAVGLELAFLLPLL